MNHFFKEEDGRYSNQLLFTVCEWWEGSSASPTRLAPVYIRPIDACCSHVDNKASWILSSRVLLRISKRTRVFHSAVNLIIMPRVLRRTTPAAVKKMLWNHFTLMWEREREKRLGHIANKKETKGGKQLAIFHTGYTFTIDYSRRTVGSSWVRVLLDFLQPIRPSAPLS
jgi:hypothetical protein